MRTWVMVSAMLAAAPLWADSQFQIRKMTRDDVPAGKGQCDIRLQVDNEAEISVKGDQVLIHTISGRDPHDDGSECNAPLPQREFPGFNFEVKDSRGEIRLTEQPNFRNGFRAIVYIHDSASGEGRYHFRLSWNLVAESAPPPPRRDSEDRRDDRRPGGGGLTWNNNIHSTGRGRGDAIMERGESIRLSDATVDIDRGGHIQVSFRMDRGAPLVFTGSVISWQDGQMKADMGSEERFLRVNGPMTLNLDSRQDVTRITMEAFDGQHRLRLTWDRR